ERSAKRFKGRTSRCSRRGRHDVVPRHYVNLAGPAAELVVRQRGECDLIREAVAETLVARALFLTLPGGGESDPAPTIATLLHDPVLARRTPQEVLGAVIALGRTVIARWAQAYPDQDGPHRALAAAEAWAAAPSPDAAELAAKAADLASKQAIAVWPGPLQHAAWAGRTVAWVAMARRYECPADAALFGACQAIGRRQVVAAVASALPEV